MKCIVCNKETKNPKFCSSSCSASYNNKIRVRKNESKFVHCSNCGKETKNPKFCSETCSAEFRKKKSVEKFLATGEGSHNTMKSYLISVHGYKCFKCENKEWMGVSIPLELEHKNGNSEDNSLNNIELLCPNCHALTPTYKAKNKGNGRHQRRERYALGKSY